LGDLVGFNGIGIGHLDIGHLDRLQPASEVMVNGSEVKKKWDFENL